MFLTEEADFFFSTPLHTAVDGQPIQRWNDQCSNVLRLYRKALRKFNQRLTRDDGFIYSMTYKITTKFKHFNQMKNV